MIIGVLAQNQKKESVMKVFEIYSYMYYRLATWYFKKEG